MPSNTGVHKQNTSDFKCKSCGYIHTLERDGSPPECIKCGARKFEEVDNATPTQDSNEPSIIAEQLSRASGKQMILYVILALIFFGSLFGIFLLLVFG